MNTLITVKDTTYIPSTGMVTIKADGFTREGEASEPTPLTVSAHWVVIAGSADVPRVGESYRLRIEPSMPTEAGTATRNHISDF